MPLKSEKVAPESFLEQVRIVRRKILASDIERLKKKVGVWKTGEEYNKKINGYGTGWRPPKEEEWMRMVDDGYIVEKVSLGETIQTPSFVDHTTKPWFPPIGNQGSEGSCVAWAVGYYMKTFQEAKEHNWNLSGAIWDGGQPSVNYQDRIISPDFIYHLINSGVDGGSSSWTAINLICSVGACSWEKMPYNPSDSASWPSEEAWREAPLYRGNSSGYEMLLINTDEGLTSLKNWIASENLAVITVDGSKLWKPAGDLLTLDNYAPPWNTEAWHAVTVVGYDDYFTYTEQGETRHGAFKMANSWGVGGWENVADGCFWISYEVMKQRVGWCEFYHDRISYFPELVASFRITHSKRGECNIAVGVGSQTKSFNDYILGGDQPFCLNNILFDITELKDTVPNIYGQQFFLKVYDGGSSTTGTIYKFAVEYAESTDTPVSTVNGGNVYAYVTLFPLETNWKIGKQVNSDNDFLDSKVSIATDSNGYLYVAYDDWYPAINQYAVFVQRSTDGGNTWSTIKIAYDPTCNIRYPSIAIDPYNDDIFVAVEREWAPNDHDIFVIRRVNGVWSWSPVANVLGKDDRFPSITSEYQYGSLNWQYISYEYVYTYNDRDLMFAKSTDHGATWSVKKLHGDFPDYNVHAQTCITNAEGVIYIAYKWGADYNSPCEIRIDYSTDFGETWTQLTDIDGLPNGCSFPSIAATHGGSTVMIAFQYDFSTSDVDVWYSYSTDRGVSWMKGYPLFVSGFEDEKMPALTVDGGGSTKNDIRGYFHAACKVGSYVKYRKAHYMTPTSWSSPVFVSERWTGKGIAIATQYRNVTAEFHPYVAWNDERTNNIYCSTVGHVHNLNNGLKYESIQEAINAPETLSGHTLLAESRTYNEMVFVNKSVTLLGENRTDTIIYGKGYNFAVEISANNSVLDGFSVKNGMGGIYIHGCGNVTIQNNLVTNNEIGLILGYGSFSSRILQNNVTLNKRYGILISGSSTNFLRNNSIAANKYNFAVYGDGFSDFIHDIDTSNTVDGKPIYYWINEQNKSIPDDAGYVALINCTQITVQDLCLFNNGQGLLLAYTKNSTITNNVFKNNSEGILIYNSLHNLIFENNLAGNGLGIRFSDSFYNTIIKNDLTTNYVGIELFVSHQNILIENDIEANDVGIRFGNSSENSFYKNNFLNNTQQIYDYSWDLPEQYPISVNVWDDGYPTGGNYWSDYVGLDIYSGLYQNETGSDGIGDTSYIIDESNLDKYPLTQPYKGPVRNLNTGRSYPSIQESINNASDGDRIFALAGIYYEHIILNKTVSLIGENEEKTIIDGKGAFAVLKIEVNDTLVSNFTIRNGFEGIDIRRFSNNVIFGNIIINASYGIWCQESTNNSIYQNYMSSNLCGIAVVSSSFTILSENNITNNDEGLFIWESSANIISFNTIANNSYHGIIVDSSQNNTLRDNRMVNNRYNFDVSGSKLADFVHNIDASNTVNGKPIYYWINEKDKSIPTDAGYVALINCSNITVKDLELSNNAQGIRLLATTNSTITMIHVTNNEWGIVVSWSANNYISQNFVQNNSIGIRLMSSSNNTICRNEIIENTRGIWLYESSNNTIYNNNFRNNFQQVVDYAWNESEVNPSINIWDVGYPFGGNYWSDYAGADEFKGPNQDKPGSDGIGDNLYLIDENNRDNFPLMNPWPTIHEISIVNITFSTTNPKVNDTLCIYVTVQNFGHFTETFDISVNYTLLFDPLIGTQTVMLAPGETITLNFTWSPTASGRHEIKAYISEIFEDLFPENNTLTTYLYVTTYYTASTFSDDMEIGLRGGRFSYLAYTI